MTGDARSIEDLLHELAEGLQAAISHVDTARRSPLGGGRDDAPVEPALLEILARQLERATQAYFQLCTVLVPTSTDTVDGSPSPTTSDAGGGNVPSTEAEVR